MLRARELFYVHAGVVTVDEKAIVIPGLSRAGKSTLVLALLLSGARYLSDELLVFDPQKGRALPFLRSLKLRPVCLPSFPGAERLVVGEGEGTFLPSSRLRELGAPTPVEGDPARVGAVVIPSWASGAPTRLEPASRGKAFLALTSSALNFGTHRERSLSHLRSLVEDAECFHLSFSDPHDAARAVRKAVLAGDEDTGR
jgi:hypothetical protein